MWKTNGNGFVTRLNPMLTLGNILGITFFSPNLKDTLFNRVKTLLYYLPVLVMYIFLNYVGIVSVRSGIVYADKTVVKNNTYFINLVFTVITSTVKPVYFYAKRGEFKTVLLGIDGMDVLTSKTYKHPNYKKKIFIAVVLIFVIFLTNGTLAYFSSATLGAHPFLYFLCYSMQQHVIWLEFLVLQSILSECHRQLATLNDKLYSLSRGSIRRCTESVLSVSKKAAMATHFIRTVTDIVDAQRKMAYISFRCLNILTVPSILVFGFEFFATLTNVHFIASSLRLWVMEQKCDVYLGLWALTVAVMSFAFIVVVLLKFVGLSTQARKTVTYVHDIWNNLATRDEVTADIKHLQLISLQLYNSKLEFTAYGFFPLDWTLLQKIVAAMTTYVVILIQFEIASTANSS